MKLFIILIALFSFTCRATEVSIETGLVRNPYSRFAVPGDDGTSFSLAQSLDESWFYHRLSLSQKIKGPHGLRLLYAPLRITGSETYSKDINFQGVNFSSGVKTETEYQFNSYRASYFFEFHKSSPWLVRIGGTLKVRDAKTKLIQPGKTKFIKNSGIVPLLYFYTEYRPGGKFRIAFDFDGWVAPQGRALDGALMGGYYFQDNFHVNLGYRILEGGVDNDKIYNFSRFEYVFTSLQLNF